MPITVTLQWEVEVCPNCGMQFGVSGALITERRRNHRSLYCPNGHSYHYPGKSDVEKAQEETRQAQAKINEEQHLRLVAERERDKEAQKRKKIERRIAKGVCPCCNRTFGDLQRHMLSKHKDYALPEGKRPRIEAPPTVQ